MNFVQFYNISAKEFVLVNVGLVEIITTSSNLENHCVLHWADESKMTVLGDLTTVARMISNAKKEATQ